MTDEAPRTCVICGAQFTRRHTENHTVYRVRQYCSRTCAATGARRLRGNARIPQHEPDTKTCLQCGRSYWRPGHISAAVWAQRQFCSHSCARLHALEVPPVCECGAAATVTVWVVQLTANGNPVSVAMEVCPDCAPLVDGGSLTPHVINDPGVCFGWTPGERQHYHATAHFAWVRGRR
jgi:hypothetical protein